MRRSIFSLLLLSAIGMTNAQTGIRFTFLDFDRTTTKLRPNLILGLDHDLGDRIAIGIDVIKGYRFDPDAEDTQIRSWGIQYRSKFFFAGSGYIASTIGFRRLSISMSSDPYGTYYSMYGTYPPPLRAEQVTIVPVGIRLGFRSELDGWYGDIYGGVGYNIGANKQIFPTTEYSSRDPLLNAVWLNIGYAYGIGWD